MPLAKHWRRCGASEEECVASVALVCQSNEVALASNAAPDCLRLRRIAHGPFLVDHHHVPDQPVSRACLCTRAPNIEDGGIICPGRPYLLRHLVDDRDLAVD